MERAENFGPAETHEIFMRHRCPLMRVDLSSLPSGSTIHAAIFIVVRASTDYDKDRNPETNPSMWVVEPCNRDWAEYECNAYEYAKGKFWTDGSNTNHGFMLHCDEHDWMGRAYYREAKEVRNRPAVLVIYTPADQK